MYQNKSCCYICCMCALQCTRHAAILLTNSGVCRSLEWNAKSSLRVVLLPFSTWKGFITSSKLHVSKQELLLFLLHVHFNVYGRLQCISQTECVCPSGKALSAILVPLLSFATLLYMVHLQEWLRNLHRIFEAQFWVQFLLQEALQEIGPATTLVQPEMWGCFSCSARRAVFVLLQCSRLFLLFSY